MSTIRRVPGGAKGPLNKALVELDKANVRVGWFESSKYPDEHSTPVAYVAAINELGPHARPFMRTTAEERDIEWSDLMFKLSKRVITGKMTTEQALEAVGIAAGADVQKKITDIARAGGLSLITLLARKARSEGQKVTGATIGEFAARVKADPAKVAEEVAGIADSPLNDTGYMLATLAASVNDKSPIFVNEDI